MNEASRWLDLVLVYEDLTPEERADVDAELERRPDLRALLRRLQEIEGGPHGSMPDLADTMTARERASAERSLAELQRKVARRLGAREPSFVERILETAPGWWRRFTTAPSWVRAAVPAAAVILAVVLSLPESSPVGPLEAIPVAHSRGIDVDEDRKRAGDREWRAGDAFILRCVVQHPVVPVLFHVDPAGEIVQLVPQGEDWRTVSGALEFPEPGSGEEWRLEGRGTETFVLATSGRKPARFDALLEEVEALRTSGAPRHEIVRELGRILSARFDDVRATDVSHE